MDYRTKEIYKILYIANLWMINRSHDCIKVLVIFRISIEYTIKELHAMKRIVNGTFYFCFFCIGAKRCPVF